MRPFLTKTADREFTCFNLNEVCRVQFVDIETETPSCTVYTNDGDSYSIFELKDIRALFQIFRHNNVVAAKSTKSSE